MFPDTSSLPLLIDYANLVIVKKDLLLFVILTRPGRGSGTSDFNTGSHAELTEVCSLNRALKAFSISSNVNEQMADP